MSEVDELKKSVQREIEQCDEFLNGEMHFDYRMKPGVVNHSNALELMRAVGLRV